jgi:ABC-type Fe3+ transport system substrate-binding protein
MSFAFLNRLDNVAALPIAKAILGRNFALKQSHPLARLSACLLSSILLLTAAGAMAASETLVKAAQGEKEVNWYTTLVVNQIVQPMAEAFQAKYDIKVNFVPAPWQETALKIINEARAGTPIGDLFDAAPTLYPLKAAGLVASYVPEEAKDFPAELKDPDGLWTANILQMATPAINTDMVSDSDAPKSLDDLLDPKWQGKMAWTSFPSVAGPVGFIGYILKIKGESAGMDYLKRLAKQSVSNVPSNQRVVLDQVISGQYPLALSVYNYHAAISASEGAPVKWLKLDPTLLTFGTTGLVKNGPHPNAAKLLIEFMLSPEGQAIVAKAGYIPANPKVAATVAELKPEVGKFKTLLMTPDEYAKNEDAWTKIYQDLFQ